MSRKTVTALTALATRIRVWSRGHDRAAQPSSSDLPAAIEWPTAEDPLTIDYPMTNGSVRFEPDAESPPGTPRWVKLFGIGAVVFVLLVAGLHLTGHTPTHGMSMEHSIQMP